MTSIQAERRKNSDTDAYFNAQFDASPKVVEPGQALFSDDPSSMLVASVGSGVTVSFFDSEAKMGVLAYTSLSPEVLEVFPYFKDANDAMLEAAFLPLDEALKLLKNNGAGKNRLHIRIMGGADFMQEQPDSGTKNAVFVSEYLSRNGLSVMNQDLGGRFIRRVHFFPETGRAVRILLKRQSDYEFVQALETNYHTSKV